MTSILERILNLIAPKACAVCGLRMAPGEEILCGSCNLKLPRTQFWTNPYENEMAQCFWGRIPIERCAAWIYHQGSSWEAQMVYALKYRGHREFGAFLGQMMAEEMLPYGFFDGIDALVPVPLARTRLRERGYNQSEEIAKGVREVTRLPLWAKGVKRTSFTSSQTQKDRWERIDNVEGKFRLTSQEQVRNRHLLLIDDICTTGATLIACANALQEGGPVKFSILTLGYAKS